MQSESALAKNQLDRQSLLHFRRGITSHFYSSPKKQRTDNAGIIFNLRCRLSVFYRFYKLLFLIYFAFIACMGKNCPIQHSGIFIVFSERFNSLRHIFVVF